MLWEYARALAGTHEVFPKGFWVAKGLLAGGEEDAGVGLSCPSFPLARGVKHHVQKRQRLVHQPRRMPESVWMWLLS